MTECVVVDSTWGPVHVHHAEECAGQETGCPFHRPSEHHMQDFRMFIRMDRLGYLTERICPHGVGHPDPDSVAFLETRYPEEDYRTHGCDGCCGPRVLPRG